MPQGARRDLDARDANVSDVPSQASPILIKIVEPGLREKSSLRQYDIKRRTGMAFAKDETIALDPVRTPGINPQSLRVKHRQQFDHGESRAEMRALRSMDHSQYSYSNPIRKLS